MNEKRILKRAKKLLKYPNTFGYKIEDGRLIVMVEKKVSKAVLSKNHILPERFMGLKVNVVEEDIPRVLSNHRATRTTMIGGISISEQNKLTAGTLGVVVSKVIGYILKEKNSKKEHKINVFAYKFIKHIAHFWFEVKEERAFFALTNEHVSGNVDTLIRQPGRLDTVHGSVFGKTYKISGMKKNNVDAALIKFFRNNGKEYEILGFNKESKGFKVDRSLGIKVMKSGRTTGVTEGYIRNSSINSYIYFQDNSVVLYTDLLEIIGYNGVFSQGGDSGSVILDEEGYIIGLLFAGSSTRSLAIPIERVIKSLDL